MPAIEVKGLTYSYDGKTNAVDHISFEVEKGEVFGFLGPSGAGKSTTIKLLTRLIAPPRGTVFLLGQDMAQANHRFYRRIGIAFENDVLYPTLTGYENLYFHASLYGVKKEAIHSILRQMDIYHAKDKRVAEYSKGMKTRLVLARAMVTNPEILFLDEPTSGMDPEIAAHVRELLKGLNRHGTTMFVTTHDMHEAEKLCDRIAFFNKAKIVEIDTPSNYKKRYGRSSVVVEYPDSQRVFNREKELSEFIRAIQDNQWSSIHSQEATLEEIFIKVVGRGLKGE
ncbi:ABC transporter ATP-binding protein [Ammoniphilus sp. CFH 90114]|uniref:ABC transporter ATP-binding protein n=1 Tax=Ammoniphilus sp. CFH 90114 TaxID=2493665 RepID=UPI0013E8FD79|nr:ABC transporter ATP-binding protein [Ammoniphilus sp. CFH 90114]